MKNATRQCSAAKPSSIAKQLWRAVLTGFLLMPVALITTPGCSQASQLCDTFCECTKCSDRAYDECVLQVDEQIDTASAYDCSEQADAVFDCITDTSKCEENTNSFSYDCNDKEQVLSECERGASSEGQNIDNNGSGDPAQQASSAAGRGSTPSSCCDCECGGECALGFFEVPCPQGDCSCTDICASTCNTASCAEPILASAVNCN